jgi:hypothetical protein
MAPRPFNIVGKVMTIHKRVIHTLCEQPFQPESSSSRTLNFEDAETKEVEEAEDGTREPTEQELGWQAAYQLAAYHTAYTILIKALCQTHPDDHEHAALAAQVDAIREAGQEMESIARDPRRDPQWSRRAMRPYVARSAAKGVRVLLIDELDMREFRADVRAGHWEGMQELLDAELGPDPGVNEVDEWVNCESGEMGEQAWWIAKARKEAWPKAGDAEADRLTGEVIKSATTSKLEDVKANIETAHYSLRSFKHIVEARSRLVKETSDFVWVSGQGAGI